jgi:hypothetical protein
MYRNIGKHTRRTAGALDPDPGKHFAFGPGSSRNEIDKDVNISTLILLFTKFIIKMIET